MRGDILLRVTPERWGQIESLYHAAADRQAEDRQDFLTRECAGDPQLLEEVESLLAREDVASGVLDGISARSAIRPIHEGMIGQQLGPWRLISVIGSGGMGSVYRAERSDQQFSQSAAIKLIAPAYLTAPMERRFREERQILARLEHPRIARLIDGGVAPDGSPYLVMEYVAGTPIDAWCASQASMTSLPSDHSEVS